MNNSIGQLSALSTIFLNIEGKHNQNIGFENIFYKSRRVRYRMFVIMEGFLVHIVKTPTHPDLT